MLDRHLNQPWWILRLVFGLVPLLAGLDKFFHLLTDWTKYLNPLATSIVPVSPTTFMHIVGVIEIVVGLLVLTKVTRIGAYIVTVWLILIALNLVTMGRYLDIAVRDLAMASGAYALARMTEVREKSTRTHRVAETTPLTPHRTIPV